MTVQKISLLYKYIKMKKKNKGKEQIKINAYLEDNKE